MTASILVLGCRKDDSAQGGKGSKPFLHDGVAYSTLQEAADAALKIADGGYETIQLTSDASGDGAVLYSSETGGLIIDFKDFEYTLAPGRSIYIADNYVNLTGSGGGIKTTGSAPAVIATDGILYLTDDVNIDAENLFQSSSTIVAHQTFEGRLSGNVLMEKAPFMLYSSDCEISIPELKADGEGSGFFIYAYPAEKICLAAIGKVTSDQKYPVTSSVADIVRVSDGNLHVHNYTKTSEPSTCSLPARTHLVCSECGSGMYEYEDSDERGSCSASDLIYHEQAELSDYSLGNVEYWECPWCGRVYSDAEGKNELKQGVTIFPEALFTDRDLLTKYDDILNLYSDEKDAVDPGVFIGIAAMIETAVFSIPGLKDWINGQNASSFATIIDKLDKISGTLEVINAKLTAILQAVKLVDQNLFISQREKDLVILNKRSEKFCKEALSKMKLAIEATKAKQIDTANARWREITNIAKDWENYDGANWRPYEFTLRLLSEYTGIGIAKSVPEMYENLVNERFLWEHEGYNTRTQFIEYENSILDKATALSYLYLSLAKEYQYPGSREIELKTLKDTYKSYMDLRAKEKTYMKLRDSLYRVNVQDNTVYEKTLKEYDFAGWLKKHPTCRLPRNNDDGQAAKTLHKMESDLDMPSLDKFMNIEQAKVITDYYKHRKDTNSAFNLYDTLATKNGFKNCPKKYAPEIIFFSQKGWEHQGGDEAQPRYEFFWWYCTRMHNNEDQFGIRSCLRENGEIMREKILENCDIDSHSKGNIQSLGKVKEWKFRTIVNAKNVKKRQ